MDIHHLCKAPLDLDAVAAFLDSLHHEGRVVACRSLTGQEQARLFEAAEGYRKTTVEDIVPASVAPLVPVPHWGKNSLPAFTVFQKVFCRPDDTAARDAGELWGYNEFGLKAFTGPGYYVAYNLPDGEVLVDYTRIPGGRAPGWPRVIPNSRRLGRFIYYGTQDTLRGVSEHVTIGRAARDGEWMPNWFVLVRQDPA
ncbi:MAG: hypothetical protein IT198_16865 [Acidimicrobiia bacterium]|nr:hypothetical protein [Acidimicrobiia bacterium]